MFDSLKYMQNDELVFNYDFGHKCNEYLKNIEVPLWRKPNNFFFL